MVSRVGLFWENPIIKSVLPVVDGATHARVDENAIAVVARWLAHEQLSSNAEIPGMTREEMIALHATLSVINFAYTDFNTSQKFEAVIDGQVHSDATAAFKIFERALQQGKPVTSGQWMKDVTKKDLNDLLAGNIEMPLLDEKVAMLNQVGEVLVAKFGGSWAVWFDSCTFSLYANGNGLLERIETDFPRFRDHSLWKGHDVHLQKLAQLTFSTINAGLLGRGLSGIPDVHQLTAFADYIVPLALEVMGILTYTKELSEKIMTGKEIIRDSEEEVEIRACSIYAVTRLADEVNALRPANAPVLPCQLDYRIWSHYHASLRPHHLTRTIMY